MGYVLLRGGRECELPLCCSLAAYLLQLTYALGVLLRATNWSDITDALPWLVGSIGTVAFDIVIVAQCMCYRNPVTK